MAAIGRLDLSHGLKRLLELTGSFSPSIGEGIVPTVQIADLENGPFSIAIPFVGHVVTVPIAGNYAWAIVRLGPAPENTIVSIDAIYSDINISASPWVESAAPVLPIFRFCLAARQETSSLREVRECEIGYGQSGQAASLNSPIYSTAAQTGIRTNWAIGRGGCIAIISTVVNVAMNVSIHGRVHLTSSR